MIFVDLTVWDRSWFSDFWNAGSRIAMHIFS